MGNAGGAAAAPDGRRTILIADDDAGVRQLLCSLLTADFLVTTAADGDAAIGLIESGGSFDAVLSDYSMPGSNGIEVLQRARQRLPSARLYLMSGALPEIARQQATETGATVVAKPFDGAEIKKLLAESNTGSAGEHDPRERQVRRST